MDAIRGLTSKAHKFALCFRSDSFRLGLSRRLYSDEAAPKLLSISLDLVSSNHVPRGAASLIRQAIAQLKKPQNVIYSPSASCAALALGTHGFHQASGGLHRLYSAVYCRGLLKGASHATRHVFIGALETASLPAGRLAISGLAKSLLPGPAGFAAYCAVASKAAQNVAINGLYSLKWHPPAEYFFYVNRLLIQAISPCWPFLHWPSFTALMRQTYLWLPSLPRIRQFHLSVLSALNTVGANLPYTLAITVAEIIRSDRAAKARQFEFYVSAPSGSGTLRPAWWRDMAASLASTTMHMARLTWLMFLFAPVILSAPLALMWNLYRSEWMELLRRTLETAGAFFIKWGQWAATRHDIFPPDMCKELEMLHTQAPAHRFKHTKKAIEEAFGMRCEDIFEYIDTQPVASGSIGQIHRARLSSRAAAITGFEPGEVVAVKVRHPGTADAILRDFETMLWVAHVFSQLPALKYLRLEDTLKQFAAPLKEQVDLAREASNLQRFNYNFRHTEHVRFPVPIYPLVSTDVLVETYEEGDHITDYIKSQHNPYNHRLSVLGSGTMLQMMLVDNLIHSDLHPGNILVRLNPPAGLVGLVYQGLEAVKNSAKIGSSMRARIDNLQQRWLQPQLVLLDVGMATELSEEDRLNMVGLFRSFSQLDGRACGDWTLRFSGAEQACPDPEAFKTAMQQTFDEIKRIDTEGLSWDSSCFRNSADALANVLELVRLYQVSLPGHICAVVVTTLVLEGWSNKLDPDHSVLRQVNKMFEGSSVPWRERIAHLVDEAMQDEDNHLTLTW